MTSVDITHILLNLISLEETTAYVLTHPITEIPQCRKSEYKLMTNLLVGRVSASVWVWFFVTDECWVVSVGQELTWEVHLCPGPCAVCLTSAVWVHRHHHRNQTAPHCGWLCLCLCYSSQSSPAGGRGKPRCKLCEDCKYSLHRLNIRHVMGTIHQTYVFDLALHFVGISWWEVS